MIAPGADGGIVAYILSEYFDYDVFIDVGYTIYNNSTSFDFYSEKQYTLINTNRLRVFLSKAIQDMPNKENKKILIIDITWIWLFKRKYYGLLYCSNKSCN